jgi:hypothetical protein
MLLSAARHGNLQLHRLAHTLLNVSCIAVLCLFATAVASPHVAGVAATCLASGACPEATGYANSALLQAAARERLSMQPAYGFSGDTRNANPGKFYGNLVWAKW